MIYCSDTMRDNTPMIDKVLGWENKQGWVTPSKGVQGFRVQNLTIRSQLFTMIDRTLGLWDGGKDSSSRVKWLNTFEALMKA